MKPEWEDVTEDGNTERLYVYGGWIVRTWIVNYDGPNTTNTVFVADPNHEWTV